jgi:hypothetical protein
MSFDLQVHLENAISSLERLQEQIEETQDYLCQQERIQILIELIKEQIPHENTRNTAGKTR